MGSIYRIYPRNKPEFYYIGCTTQTLEERLKQHKSSYKSYCNGNVCWISSFRILEEDSEPVIELVEFFPNIRKFELMEIEKWYIRVTNCVNPKICQELNLRMPNALIKHGYLIDCD